MTSTYFRIALVMGLALMGAPAVAGAQQSSDQQQEANSSESTDESTKDSGDQTESETSGDSAEETAEADQASEGSADDQQAESGDTQSDGDGAGEQQKRGDASEEDKTPETGPGGREMRSDYPGKDEAKQGQMETDRIEGLQFKEGQNPSEAYDVQIQELETKIDDLKEKVFQSKSRVVLLKETVLGGNLSGSRAVIKHVNGLGGRFKLRRAMYSLDGNRVFNQSQKSGELPGVNEFSVYDDSITTGQHNVSVLLEYRGSGFGIFNYMEGYRFEITSSCQFTAEAGKTTTLKVHAVDKAGAFAGVERKPGIKCELKKKDLAGSSGTASSSSSESTSGSAANTGGGGQSSGGGD